MGKLNDPVLDEAFARIEDTWKNSRYLIECCYCRIDEHLRTVLPGDQHKPALVVPLDYDGVVPVSKKRHAFPALVQMFDSRVHAMAAACSEVLPLAANCHVSEDATDDVSPYSNNPFFTGIDARIAYGLACVKKPNRIVEVGSGNSTRFFRKAIVEANLQTRLTAIDPEPRLEISKVADDVIRESILDVDVELFANLSPGDMVFFDGSHLCFHGSDVTHFFLRILPELACGVLVHVHDIFLPFEYPEHFDIRSYNEQYVLAAFLMNNADWSATLPVHYLFAKGLLQEDGGSFWMTRTAKKG
jgi:hypothetical protein